MPRVVNAQRKGKMVKQKGRPKKFHAKKKAQFKPPNKMGRIVIRNLSFKSTEEIIQKHFGQFGAIREVNLLKRPDGNLVGCGFVQYNEEDHAARAIEKSSGTDFLGRTIQVDWALQRDRYSAPPAVPTSKKTVDFDDEPQEEDDVKPMFGKTSGTLASNRTVDFDDDGNDVKPFSSSTVGSNNDPEAGTKKQRSNKELRKEKKGRIIIRNLPFRITNDDLRNHLSSYGSINEVNLLRHPDGRLVGCGFVQFEDRKAAAKAILECSGKPILGRPVVLDWAIQKKAYKANNPVRKAAEKDVKAEVNDDKMQLNDSVLIEPKAESNSGSDSGVEAESSDEDGSDNEDDEDVSDADDDSGEEDESDNGSQAKRPRFVSNDVSEGRTVFIKNVPFSATNSDLKECMEQFGPLFYALICVDRMTEHSKGSAFVKFKTTESAEKCLSAGTELTIHGQVLDPHKALNRDEVQAKDTDKSDGRVTSKDNRNLYLIKEGVILAGSPAAVGVSVTDMAKRLQLEQWKSQMLQKLNMFVARDRLAVHNLPPTYDDNRLRQLFQKHSGPNAVIKEAKVMRDMKNLDLKGVVLSKETGFVRFSTHEDALKALRSLNNNPNIFSRVKRPIVAFSIENKAIHNVRQKREQKSKTNNPTFKKHLDTEDTAPTKLKFSKVESRKQKRNKEHPAAPTESKVFSGVAAKPGDMALRSKYKLKSQAVLHMKTAKKDKSKNNSNKRYAEQKKIEREAIKQPKQKHGKKKMEEDDRSFGLLVNKYKSQIDATSSIPNKWYEG